LSEEESRKGDLKNALATLDFGTLFPVEPPASIGVNGNPNPDRRVAHPARNLSRQGLPLGITLQQVIETARQPFVYEYCRPISTPACVYKRQSSKFMPRLICSAPDDGSFRNHLMT
jgi:hypothetical protein